MGKRQKPEVGSASRWPAGARSCSSSPHIPQTPQTPQFPRVPALPIWYGKRVFVVPKAFRKVLGSGKTGDAVRNPYWYVSGRRNPTFAGFELTDDFSPPKRPSAGQITLKRTFLRQNVIWPDKSQRLPSTSVRRRPFAEQNASARLARAHRDVPCVGKCSTRRRMCHGCPPPPRTRRHITSPPRMASATARYEPIPAFPLTPGMSVCPVPLSAASATARYEPIPAFPLTPGQSVCPVPHSAASASARCEPFPAFPLTPGQSVCPVPHSAASASARYEPFPAFPLTPGRHFAAARNRSPAAQKPAAPQPASQQPAD